MFMTVAAITISGTVIDVAPSNDRRIEAIVTIDNAMMNGPSDTGAYALPWGNEVIGAFFTWDAGPRGEDQVTIVPPQGFACIPMDCTATVTEGGTGEILIVPFMGY